MNISTSECSSGCESGWTMYLDQLSNSTYQEKGENYVKDEDEYIHDEDLSMVSDASSAPPNLRENYVVDSQYYGCYVSTSVPEDRKNINKTSKTKVTTSKMKQQQHNLCLDDTATSPMLHFSQDNAVPPENQAFSSAYFEEEPTPKKHLGLLKYSTKGK